MPSLHAQKSVRLRPAMFSFRSEVGGMFRQGSKIVVTSNHDSDMEFGRIRRDKPRRMYLYKREMGMVSTLDSNKHRSLFGMKAELRVTLWSYITVEGSRAGCRESAQSFARINAIKGGQRPPGRIRYSSNAYPAARFMHGAS